MKKILSLILCLMLSCSLVGCGESNHPEYITIAGRHFMILDIEGNDEYLYIDIAEKTQYLYMDGGGYGGGLTLLVDSEGKPLLYEGEIPYERTE